MKVTAMAASIAFVLAATVAAAVVLFILPETLAALVADHAGAETVEFVRSLV
jgi:hypothetical protein